jgi:hypothetical protein
MLGDLLWRRARRHDHGARRQSARYEPWEWHCGFYPRSRPDECTTGTAETFDRARAEFKAACRVFFANRAEADFQVWRDREAWTAEKYRRFDRGERMTPDWRPQQAAGG